MKNERDDSPPDTQVRCITCGKNGDVDNMIPNGDFFFCDAYCMQKFYGELE